MNSSADEVLVESRIEEAIDEIEDTLFIPTKRVKSTFDHEIGLYSSMYKSVASNYNPLDFWKSVEEVCNFDLINNLFLDSSIIVEDCSQNSLHSSKFSTFRTSV